MTQRRRYQGRRLPALDAAPERDLLKFGIVHGVEGFAPRLAARLPTDAGARTVSDYQMLFSPASKRAYTTSGGKLERFARQALLRILFAIAAVASP